MKMGIEADRGDFAAATCVGKQLAGLGKEMQKC